MASHGQKRREKPPTAARQRRLAFELERHALEANALTQFFITLAKRSSSWWNAGGDTDEGATADASMSTTLPLAEGPPSPSKSTASAHHTPHHHGVGSKSLNAPTTDPNVLMRRRRELAEQRTAAVTRRTGGRIALQIPDTVVWENNIPKGWFSFDAKEGHVARRKVETKQIQESFLRDALFENDVVAVVYSVPHQQEEESEQLSYRYLTAAQLPLFLFENRRGKGTSILQKFVYPLNIQHNDCLQVVWSPSVVQVNRRQNIHDIFDERVPPNDRCATFEGRTHLSRDVQCTARLHERIARVCDVLVKHFRDVEHNKFVISRMVLHLKITDTSELVLLYGSSARVVSATVALPVPLPSGMLLIADPAAQAASQLQKKYRVSLELATRYHVKEVDDPSHERSSQSEDLAALTEVSRRGSMVAKNQDMAATSPTQAVVHVTVDDRPASHHGFIMRGQPLTPSSSPKKKAPSGRGSPQLSSHSSPSASPIKTPVRDERGRLMSLRSSSADRLSLIGIAHDALRLGERDVSDQQKSRIRQLLQSALAKAGQTSMRAALLQTRPASELSEFEKMELLYLKLAGMERRKMRRSSTSLGSFVETAVSESMMQSRESEGGGGSNIARKKNVVFDGALSLGVEEGAEERWEELCYAAQTHFDTLPAFPGGSPATSTDATTFEFAFNGASSAVDAAIVRWLVLRKAAVDDVANIRRGVTQREGATLAFDLVFATSTDGSTARGPCVVKVPHQIRASQKLFHEAHEALCAEEFAQILSEEMEAFRTRPAGAASVETDAAATAEY